MKAAQSMSQKCLNVTQLKEGNLKDGRKNVP